MPNYAYVALDAHGHETRGALSVDNQSEALRRLKEMGFFPTKVSPESKQTAHGGRRRSFSQKSATRGFLQMRLALPGFQPRVKHRTLITFTRQMATLLEAGMPLLRGLQLIGEQESEAGLRRIIAQVSESIEGGASFSEALAAHPKAFNRLYVQMVKAGEISGAVDVVLARLAGFMEKAHASRTRLWPRCFTQRRLSPWPLPCSVCCWCSSYQDSRRFFKGCSMDGPCPRSPALSWI